MGDGTDVWYGVFKGGMRPGGLYTWVLSSLLSYFFSLPQITSFSSFAANYDKFEGTEFQFIFDSSKYLPR